MENSDSCSGSSDEVFFVRPRRLFGRSDLGLFRRRRPGIRPALGLCEHREKARLVENADPELLGLGEFGSGFGPGHDEVRLFAHRTRNLGTHGEKTILGLVSRHRGERARQNEGLSRELARSPFDGGPGDACSDEFLDHGAVVGFAKEREDALCDDAAHVLDRGELFEFGRLELRERTEVLSKRECRASPTWRQPSE